MYRKITGTHNVKIFNFYKNSDKLDIKQLQNTVLRPLYSGRVLKDLNYYTQKDIPYRVKETEPPVDINEINMSNQTMHEKILGKNGIYMWVLHNIKVKELNPKEQLVDNPWSIVKVGMTAQDNGFLRRIPPEMRDANTLNTPGKQYNLSNIICTINGLQFCGHESIIRSNMGIHLGNAIFDVKRNIKTIEKLLTDNKDETIESFVFKNKSKLKVCAWALWLTGKKRIQLGPSELIIMHNDDIEKIRRIYKFSDETSANEQLVRFRGIKTNLSKGEIFSIEYDSPNNPGPLIFGL